jgi:hypothetical protein
MDGARTFLEELPILEGEKAKIARANAERLFRSEWRVDHYERRKTESLEKALARHRSRRA